MPRATQGAATAGPRSGTGLSPAVAGLSSPFPSAFRSDVAALLPRRRLNDAGLGSSPFARRYWGNHVCSLLLRVLRCFSSPRSPPHLVRVTGLQPAGLPHSDIRGSQGACPSPRLFAACRVLPRLREPRYPPSALLCFLFSAGPPEGTSRLVLFPFPSHHVKDLSTVENKGIEPLTSCLQGRRSKPTELIPRPCLRSPWQS